MEEHSLDLFRGLVLPYFNFFVFLAAAIYFFRKMVLKAAATQRSDFETQMNEARAARDAALTRIEELKRRQAGLDKELADVLSMNKAAADMDAAKIAGDAERLAAHLRDEAKRIAAAEIEKARGTLRREIVEAVRLSVTAKLKTELNADSQLRLVKKQIGELQTIQAEG